MYKTALKLIIAVAATIVLVGSFHFLGSTSAKETRPILNMPLDKSASAAMEGFHFTDQDLSRMKMQINASKVTLKNRKFRQFRIATSQVLEMENPVFKVYDEKKKATEISGDWAVIDPVKKAILFRKGATIRLPRGDTLRCDNLSWRYKEGSFVVDGPYSLSRAGEIINGKDLYADMSLKALIIN